MINVLILINKAGCKNSYEYDDKIEIIIAIDNNIDKKDSDSYFEGVKSLNDWLNFVYVEDEGHKIIVDFNNVKRPPRTLS